LGRVRNISVGGAGFFMVTEVKIPPFSAFVGGKNGFLGGLGMFFGRKGGFRVIFSRK
jgi:hypothetical protein